jgi:hypothetical protein
MALELPTPVLFGRTYRLTEGTQIRFRLAGPGDHPGVSALLARVGSKSDELQLVRLLRADPRKHAVVCATALIGGRETVLGFAATCFRDAPQDGDYSVIVVDPAAGEELRALLIQALVSRLGRASQAA